jgi:hypothetical protein
MYRTIPAVIAAVIVLSIAAVISLSADSADVKDNESLMKDARLMKSFAEYASRIARNSGREVSLTIGKAGDKGHAAIIRDGTTLWELTTDDCLLAPLNYTVTFDRTGHPIEPASVVITNGSELYLDILPDGSTQINSAELPD